MKKKKFKLKENILLHSNDIWIPPNNIEFEDIKTNSWFDMKYYKSNDTNYKNNLKLTKIKENDKMLKCQKIDLKLSKQQKEILERWFNATTLMYNKTLEMIKEKSIFNYKKLRTTYLKEFRDELISGTQIKDLTYSTKIKTHIMDCEIKKACAMYKSALTNLRKGHIKHFRIRKLKHNRPRNVMEIEPVYFNKKNNVMNMCYNVFGEIKYFYNNKEIKLENIDNACNLQFDKTRNKYSLFVPRSVVIENIENRNEVISIDPGIRTFMTCLSENEVIKFGNNTNEKIKKELKRIDNIKSMKCKKKIKEKVERRCNRKIHDMVTELHWKTISYLTKNYKVILIGNLSTKSIIKKGVSKLSKMTKRLSNALSFYTLRQRLEFKSKIRNINFQIVDESYTSKTCSNCGSYKENLGSMKEYHCNCCGKTMDRDVNGSRGIYMVNH